MTASPPPIPDSSILIFKRSISRRRFSCFVLSSSGSAPSGTCGFSHQWTASPMSAMPSRTSSSNRCRRLWMALRAARTDESLPCASRTCDSSARRSGAGALHLLAHFFVGLRREARKPLNERLDAPADVSELALDRMYVALSLSFADHLRELARELAHMRHWHDLLHRHGIGCQGTFRATQFPT